MYGQIVWIDVVGDDDKEKESLLHAHLATLLDGVEPGHVSRDSFLELTDAFKAELVLRRLLDANGIATGVSMRAEVVWSAFSRAATATADKLHPHSGLPHALSDTRDPDADYRAMELLTLSRMEWHSAAVRAGALSLGLTHLTAIRSDEITQQAGRRDRMAEMVRCLVDALKDPAIAAAFLKGHAERIVWASPIEGRVADLLAQTDAHGVEQGALDELRNLLGLWKEDGHEDHPLAAFCLLGSIDLKAPNVITASGYPRFRHRCPDLLPAAPNAGLTYNLDQQFCSRRPGSCEVVSAGVTLAQISAITLAGQPSALPNGRAETLTAHREYAATVSRGRSWPDVLTGLESRL